VLDLANIAPPPILIGAEDNVDLLDLAIVVAIVVGMGVVSIIKKAMAQAEEKRSRQSIDQARQQAQQQSEQPKPMRPDEGLARTVRRSMGMPDQPQPQPLQAADDGWMRVAAPVTVEPPPPKVQEAQIAQPARKKARKRKKRKKQDVGTLAQEAEAPQAVQEAPLPAATLYDYDSARKAILHYEILAPPKALRNKPEMWEL